MDSLGPCSVLGSQGHQAVYSFHPDDLLMSATFTTPQSVDPPRYTPLQPRRRLQLSKLLEILFRIHDITEILLLDESESETSDPYDPAIFRIETASGSIYEYTRPHTRHLDPGPQLLRHVLEDGSTTGWVESPFMAEALEIGDRERREAGWGRPLPPTTAESRIAVNGLKELGWMGLRGRDKGHAAIFYIRRGKPEMETEEQREEFVQHWLQHAAVCKFERRVCE